MSATTATFIALRPRLHGIAYRMLGSVPEAEDVVQDVWLRWHGTDATGIDNPEAWLVTATTRRAIDQLRAARTRREQYVGIWLPEPVLTDDGATPEDLQELASDVSVAFLALLERLAPEARAAFLLREVFDEGYPEVARVLGKSEAACRQLVHRAKEQLRDERPRFEVNQATHASLVRGFASAMASGDFRAMRDMLAPDAQLLGDGGGHVTSFPKPMEGGSRIAQLLFAPSIRNDRGMRIELTRVNGELAILRYFSGALESVQTFAIANGRITAIHVQRNPEKLARLVARQAGFSGPETP
ncbi:RNA polymerase sigma-70 factor [Luteibacter aegosomaticola]|uniref:RNA polymerase sigma-70 factor n=1 Tax=Luteibacter aegosomaticola TaxID=2911538 RepID=UPI001FF73208|nr:RNA polymerase sigma-70 factor [Luteibacter aegosomaticola]UPG88455.1 RNA polymerase sigma-70 factor [Luteibacter aegosomaticola]